MRAVSVAGPILMTLDKDLQRLGAAVGVKHVAAIAQQAKNCLAMLLVASRFRIEQGDTRRGLQMHTNDDKPRAGASHQSAPGRQERTTPSASRREAEPPR